MRHSRMGAAWRPAARWCVGGGLVWCLSATGWAQSLGMAADATDGVTGASTSLLAGAPLGRRDEGWDALAQGGPLLPPKRGVLGPSEQGLFDRLRSRDVAGALQYLRTENPRLDLVDENRHTALTLAVSLGDAGLLRELVRRGAPLDEPGWQGRTPLGLAAYLGQDVSVRELLRRGADPLARSQGGQTALHLAMAGGQRGASQLLLDARPLEQWMGAYNAAGRHPLAEAAFLGRLDGVRDMAARGADLRSPDLHGLDALHAAALGRQPAMVEHLMAAGVVPRNPLTLLMLARMQQPADHMLTP